MMQLGDDDLELLEDASFIAFQILCVLPLLSLIRLL